MKIRIKDNTLRLRLMQGEVQQLRHQGEVSAQTTFAERQLFSYHLRTDDTLAAPEAHLQGSRITVSLPTAQAHRWADTDQVGISHLQPNGTPEGLRLLIEKDFKCLTDRPHEDETDAFPHPSPDAPIC